jgi:IMP cyclohydrolase
LGGRGRWISEFEASLLVYRVSSRTARNRETLSQKTNKQTNKKQKQKQKNPKNCLHLKEFF